MPRRHYYANWTQLPFTLGTQICAKHSVSASAYLLSIQSHPSPHHPYRFCCPFPPLLRHPPRHAALHPLTLLLFSRRFCGCCVCHIDFPSCKTLSNSVLEVTSILVINKLYEQVLVADDSKGMAVTLQNLNGKDFKAAVAHVMLSQIEHVQHPLCERSSWYVYVLTSSI